MEVKYTSQETFSQDISKGLVLVDFYADWCGPCQVLGPILDEVVKVNQKAQILKLNIDNAQEISGEFGVMSIPTMIVFKDGVKVDQKMGVLQASEITDWIDGL